MDKSKPRYALEHIQRLVAYPGTRRITRTARANAQELGFFVDDIVECIRALVPADHDKTMPSEKVPGLWQDVYRPTFRGRALYVKLQVITRRGGEDVVVISFKEG